MNNNKAIPISIGQISINFPFKGKHMHIALPFDEEDFCDDQKTEEYMCLVGESIRRTLNR